MGPPTDAGEEMALGVGLEIARLDINDAPFIDIARRDVPGLDEIAEPLSSERIELVVIRPRHSPATPFLI